MAGGLGVSTGTAGQAVTAPGVVAAFASVGMPLLVGRLDRRVLLAALLAVMAVASTISALAPNFAVLIGSRVLVGITIGGFWAVAGSLAMRLVPGPYVARAMVLIFGGVSAAAVPGVPIGTILGDLLGWRAAFGALAALSAAVLVAALVLLPRLPAAEPVRVGSLVAQLRNPALLAGIVATALLVAGHYGAYTFVSPALLDISGVNSGIIGPLLLGDGLLGMLANVVAGPWAARARVATRRSSPSCSATLALFPVVGASPWGGAALLMVWGLGYGGAPVTLHTWVLTAAPDSAEAATAVYCFVVNLAIAVGAAASGVVVDALGLPSVLWRTAVLVLLALLTVRRAPVPAR
jgi:predicted MFS family arabinose efflux permease